MLCDRSSTSALEYVCECDRDLNLTIILPSGSSPLGRPIKSPFSEEATTGDITRALLVGPEVSLQTHIGHHHRRAVAQFH